MGSPRMAMLLAAVLLGLGQAQAADNSDEGFGRWESPLRHCQLEWPRQAQQPPQQSQCLKVRVDQTIEGMLRVRFINGLAGSRYASEELTFAGLLLQHDQPMQCRGGTCNPSWPMRLQVHGVASRRFDPRGLAEQLPQNALARGSCQLEATQLQCQARGANGEHWQASAQISETLNRSSQSPSKHP